jgi:predicted nucleic acid-binding protein
MMIMIWIDSSFAIEWLIASSRAKNVAIGKQKLGILPQQYTEILCYFSRKVADITPVVRQLEALSLEHPKRSELILAARLYQSARSKKSKASLADAILAGTATLRKDSIASFDQDFISLGFKNEGGLWALRES